MSIHISPRKSPEQIESTERELRDQLSNSIGKRPYRMWFTNTDVRCSEDCVNIFATTPLAANWISQRFTGVIEDAAKTTFGKEIPVHISVQEKEDIESPAPHTIECPQPITPKRPRPSTLLSFDDFVVGRCNQLACAAARQITQDDGHTISPLFVHGACGVGKTHILQAICSKAMKSLKGKVRYVTAEQFTNEFIASSRSGEFGRFRARYRNLDVLAIDDVHFVANKTKTQEELLHTLDAAGLKGARLILASDEDPRHIRRLNRALANRLVAGMIAEVQRPDRETRCSIIQKLTQKYGLGISDGAIDKLASQAVGSVREIEGTVTRLRATASLLNNQGNSMIGVHEVERLLRVTPPTSHPIRMSDVIEATSTRAGLSVQELKGSSRTSSVVFWRSIATYIGRKLTMQSYPELATAMGRKNHSTVHAAVKRVTRLLEQESSSININGECIDMKEVIAQLTWAVRSMANETSEARRP